MRVKSSRHYGHSPRTGRVFFRTLGVIAMFVSLTAAASYSMARLYRAASSEEVNVGKSSDTGVGSVVVETNKQRCEILKFDNYTGRTMENSKHCQNTAVLDAEGAAVPLGTVHRLNSISKSLLGADR